MLQAFFSGKLEGPFQYGVVGFVASPARMQATVDHSLCLRVGHGPFFVFDVCGSGVELQRFDRDCIAALHRWPTKLTQAIKQSLVPTRHREA